MPFASAQMPNSNQLRILKDAPNELFFPVSQYKIALKINQFI